MHKNNNSAQLACLSVSTERTRHSRVQRFQITEEIYLRTYKQVSKESVLSHTVLVQDVDNNPPGPP